MNDHSQNTGAPERSFPGANPLPPAQANDQEKLNQFAAIIESTDDAVIGKTLAGIITSWNPAAEQIYGYSAGEIIGQPIFRLVPPDRQGEMEELMAQLKKGGRIQHFETVRQHKDGRLLEVSLTISPIKDGSGQITGASTIARDIAERKRVAELLHQRGEEFRALVENSTDIIARYDRDCRRTYVNPAYLKMAGMPEETLLGQAPAQRSPLAAEAANSLQTVIRRVLETGERGEIDLPLEIPNRGQFWFDINVIPEFDRTGRVASAISISRDITARKQGEAALQRLNRELRAISNCNQMLMRATNEPSLLQEVCRVVCEEAEYRMAWVGYAEHDGDRSVRPIAWAGSEAGYLQSVSICWSDTDDRGRGPTGTAIRTGQTVVSQSFETNHDVVPWREEALKRGYQSSIALPLKNENEVAFGAFTIYAAQPDAFTPDEIRLLEELAGDLAFGITVLRGRTERKRNEAINAARLHIMQFAATHSLDDLLEETLNEAEKLTASAIGFYHFVEADQKTLHLQNWSTRTKREFCRAEGKGMHYPIHQAGVWVDCVQTRKPVVHNDYASLPNRKGMPLGHAVVVRELVVPVLRDDKIVAILGIGNKRADYDQKDVEVLSLLADLAWEIAERKRAEQALHQLNLELETRVRTRTQELAASEERFRTIYDMAPVSIWLEDWSGVIAMTRALPAEGVADFAAWFKEHPDFVARALASVKIQDVNQWTLDMFKARDKAELLASLQAVFATPDTLVGFVGELVALAQGRTIYHTEMALNTVAGEPIQGVLAMSFPPAGSAEGNVLVTVVDITERHKLNQELQQRASDLEAANQELQRMNKLFVGRELRMVELKEKLRAIEVRMNPEPK